MRVEEMCCTLEQAEKLAALGIADKSIADWWYSDRHKQWYVLFKDKSDNRPTSSKLMFSAFTVAELGVMLGNKNTLSELTAFDDKRKWICGNAIGIDEGDYDYTFHAYGETEAQARAAFLILLLEKNLIELKQVNESLTPKPNQP